ncbi:MAG TPA: hypothetical protein VF188_15070 [Longimicrobiales bacterium]
MESLRRTADAHLQRALEREALRDPRHSYRDRLRLLRARSPETFEEARRYYEDVLLPRVAEEGADAVAEWLAYGCRLAALSGPGRIVAVDADGRARAAEPPLPHDRLLLHLPDDDAVPVLALNVPERLSPAQRATYDLLVAGKTAPAGSEPLEG